MKENLNHLPIGHPLTRHIKWESAHTFFMRRTMEGIRRIGEPGKWKLWKGDGAAGNGLSPRKVRPLTRYAQSILAAKSGMLAAFTFCIFNFAFLINARSSVLTLTNLTALGLPDTNVVKVIAANTNTPTLSNGQVQTIGLPVNVFPDTNGVINVYRMAGNYVLYGPTLGQGLLYRFPDNTSNTPAIPLSGFNTYQTPIIYNSLLTNGLNSFLTTNSSGAIAVNVSAVPSFAEQTALKYCTTNGLSLNHPYDDFVGMVNELVKNGIWTNLVDAGSCHTNHSFNGINGTKAAAANLGAYQVNGLQLGSSTSITLPVGDLRTNTLVFTVQVNGTGNTAGNDLIGLYGTNPATTTERIYFASDHVAPVVNTVGQSETSQASTYTYSGITHWYQVNSGEIFTMAYEFAGTNVWAYWDGVFCQSNNFPFAVTNPVTQLIIGQSEGNAAQVTVGSWALFNTLLTTNQVLSATRALRWLDPQTVDFIAAGDSTAYGWFSIATNSIPYLFANVGNNPSKYYYMNMAQSGTSMEQFTNVLPSIELFKPGGKVSQTINYISSGYNNVGGALDGITNPFTMFNEMSNAVSSLNLFGIDAWLNDIRTFGTNTTYTQTPVNNAARLTYNSLLSSNVSLPTRLIQQSQMFTVADMDNTNFSLDGLHTIDGGSMRVAGYLAGSVNPGLWVGNGLFGTVSISDSAGNITGTSFTGNGSGLTNIPNTAINNTALTNGIPSATIGNSSVSTPTLTFSSLGGMASETYGSGAFGFSGSISATSFSGGGAGLTGLEASGMAAGYTSTSNNWNGTFTGNGAGLTGIPTATNAVTATNASGTGNAMLTNDSRAITLPNSGNQISGTFTGNGSGLTNVNLDYGYTIFTGKPNTITPNAATNLATLDSGQTWLNYWVPGGNGTNAIITNGVMTLPRSASSSILATYASIYSPRDIVRMGADISFNANWSTNTAFSSSATICGFTSTNAGSFTTDTHVGISPSGFTWNCISNGSVLAGVGPISWSPGFVWGTNTYHIEILRYNGFGILIGPDGINYKVVNTNSYGSIGSISNLYPTWEPYQNSPATEVLPQFSGIVCSSSYSNSVSPSMNELATTLLAQQGNGITGTYSTSLAVGTTNKTGQVFRAKAGGAADNRIFSIQWNGTYDQISEYGDYGYDSIEFYQPYLVYWTWSSGGSGDTLAASSWITAAGGVTNSSATQAINSTGGFVSGSYIVIATNSLVIPAGTAFQGILWNSNNALYWITSKHTNYVAGP